MSLRRATQESDWQLCREIASTHGRSFYLASRALSSERRRSILAAYAFCRLADDVVDFNGETTDERRAALSDWERQLDRPEHPVAVAFAEVRDRYAIPEQPVRELFEGLRADLTISRYQDWLELRQYCYLVAGTVGLIVAPILGCEDTRALPRAADLGIAMQLTNILRDIREDAELGRIYLPLDELAMFGIEPALVLAGSPGPAFPDFMSMQIDRARALYEQALEAVPALSPGGRLATLVAAEVYSGILGRIESNRYDVFERRAVVSRTGKVRKLTRASVRFLSVTRMAYRPDSVSSAPQRVRILSPDADAESWTG